MSPFHAYMRVELVKQPEGKLKKDYSKRFSAHYMNLLLKQVTLFSVFILVMEQDQCKRANRPEYKDTASIKEAYTTKLPAPQTTEINLNLDSEQVLLHLIALGESTRS